MSSHSVARSMPMLRKKSIDDFNEQIINLLDELEKRVEMLRESAGSLEQEKEFLVDTLSSVNLNSELLRLGPGDRDDITATTNRLLNRCKAVQVVVNTTRSQEQTLALDSVNAMIQAVLTKLQNDLDDGEQQVRRFLNACSPDQQPGPIDQRFQTWLIECTADDQKKIRRRLSALNTQIERAIRTCNPTH